MGHPDRIQVFFAIMELEAWFLSMYQLFQKIHPSLTVPFIEEKIGFDLSKVNPEEQFFHPANEFSLILNLVGITYNKSFDQMEGILSKIDSTDIRNSLENNRCNSFARFLMIWEWG